MKQYIKGMAGKARQGKDTVGKALASKLGYKTYALAEPIKLYTHKLFGWSHHDDYESKKNDKQEIRLTLGSIERAKAYAKESGLLDYVRDRKGLFKLSKILKVLGLDSHSGPQYLTPREAWQLFGTEWGRNYVDKNIWIDLMPTSGCVITDIRFPNEAAAVRAAGGQIIQVYRPGAEVVGGVLDHESEAGMKYLEEDLFFDNSGNLASLNTRVNLMIETHFKGA